MKRKLRWLLILAILVAFAVWLEPTRVVWGWLRGEAFYDGRPTSWWERELARWEMIDLRNETYVFYREKYPGPNWLYRWFGINTDVRIEVNGDCKATAPRILRGDSNAEPILRELAEYHDHRIRRMANYGLHEVSWIQQRQNGPASRRFAGETARTE